MSYRAAALKFEVCATSVLRWVRRFEERGDVRADPPRGRRLRIEEERVRVFRILKRRPAITVPALQRALAARGLAVGDAAVNGPRAPAASPRDGDAASIPPLEATAFSGRPEPVRCRRRR